MNHVKLGLQPHDFGFEAGDGQLSVLKLRDERCLPRTRLDRALRVSLGGLGLLHQSFLDRFVGHIGSARSDRKQFLTLSHEVNQ